jgi:hypothetical protein
MTRPKASEVCHDRVALAVKRKATRATMCVTIVVGSTARARRVRKTQFGLGDQRADEKMSNCRTAKVPSGRSTTGAKAEQRRSTTRPSEAKRGLSFQ